MDLDAFFSGHSESRRIFEVLHITVASLGAVKIRVTKTQVAFRRRRAFAWAWVPAKYLRGKLAPLVLTLSLPRRSASPRWKEIVEPAKGRYTHHLELYAGGDIDAEVASWLLEAWEASA